MILVPLATEQVPVMREVAEDAQAKAMFAFDLMAVDLSRLPLLPLCCDAVIRLSIREEWGEEEEEGG